MFIFALKCFDHGRGDAQTITTFEGAKAWIERQKSGMAREEHLAFDSDVLLALDARDEGCAPGSGDHHLVG